MYWQKLLPQAASLKARIEYQKDNLELLDECAMSFGTEYMALVQHRTSKTVYFIWAKLSRMEVGAAFYGADVCWECKSSHGYLQLTTQSEEDPKTRRNLYSSVEAYFKELDSKFHTHSHSGSHSSCTSLMRCEELPCFANATAAA